jgi:RNA polymerase sigma-70 factor (ECF subfamily)
LPGSTGGVGHFGLSSAFWPVYVGRRVGRSSTRHAFSSPPRYPVLNLQPTPLRLFHPKPRLSIRRQASHNDQGDLDLIFREVDDRDLVLRTRKGNVEAYNALISRWEKKLYNYLLRITSDPEESFDLCQEVFLKAYQNLSRLDDPARFGPWIYRIAHNEAISHIRRRRPEAELNDQLAGSDPGPGMAPVEVSLAVEAALARLSPEQREAVVLKVYEGFKFEEIAQILDCPPSTIKSRVYSGMDLLKDFLSPVVHRPGSQSAGA